VQQVLGRCAVQLAATLEKKRARAGRELAVPAPSGPPPVAVSARALKELRAAVEKVREWNSGERQFHAVAVLFCAFPSRCSSGPEQL